ncbi:MAG: DUF4190 domain-containing protein [Propionibacteriales bacterium]|nr:DUF4190 domain-containing protein [Propionibacteriales bacterium]
MTTPTWGQPDEPPQPPQQPQAPYQPYGQAYGQPAANAYGQPAGQPYGYQPAPSTNALAIVSLVVSILSLTTCLGATGFIGAIMGHVSKGQIKRNNEQGAGMALAGIIIGWIGTAVFLAAVAVFIVFAVAVEDTIDDYCYTDSDGYYTCE